MNVPIEAIETVSDDKGLLAIKQAIRVEINEHLKDLEERVAAKEKKMSKIIDCN